MSHFGPDCNKLSRDTKELWTLWSIATQLGAKPMSPWTISISSIRHPRVLWAMPWRMHSPRKEQAFFLRPMTGSKWTRSHGLSNSAVRCLQLFLCEMLQEQHTAMHRKYQNWTDR